MHNNVPHTRMYILIQEPFQLVRFDTVLLQWHCWAGQCSTEDRVFSRLWPSAPLPNRQSGANERFHHV